MPERHDVPLAELTTLRLGGPARRLLEAADEAALIGAVADADRSGEAVLTIAGGSNLVIADAGFDGTVVAIRTRGVEVTRRDGHVRLRVAAGEPWDDLVARCVAEGLAGFECLSGIPGSVGATPIQNVGAYGADVGGALVAVRAYDREAETILTLDRGQCELGYRTSAFKREPDRHLVLEVAFHLESSPLSAPIAYAQLAAALDVEIGEQAPLDEVRAAVLELRRSKGMVIDPADPDSTSAGSFFTNPILSRGDFETLQGRAAGRLGSGAEPPAWPEPDGRIKTSAAWLIERAGFGRGYGTGAAGVSGKHTLALVNRGGATTDELLNLARELRDGVESAFGVRLVPEPTLIGVEL